MGNAVAYRIEVQHWNLLGPRHRDRAQQESYRNGALQDPTQPHRATHGGNAGSSTGITHHWPRNSPLDMKFPGGAHVVRRLAVAWPKVDCFFGSNTRLLPDDC